MKSKFKRAALLLAAVLLMGSLSGCMMMGVTISVGKDGPESFSYSSLVLEEFITEKCHSTPQEYFKDQIAEGNKLIGDNYKGHKYWGFETEVVGYGGSDEVLEALNETDAIKADIVKKGREYSLKLTVTVDPASINVSGTDPSEYEEYEELAICRLKLSCPYGWYDPSDPDIEFDKGKVGDKNIVVTLPCKSESYTYTIYGLYRKPAPVIYDLFFDIDEPEIGSEPGEPRDLTAGDGGDEEFSVMPCSVYWLRSKSPNTSLDGWEEIAGWSYEYSGEGYSKLPVFEGPAAVFEPGYYYAVLMTVKSDIWDYEFTFGEGVTAEVNGRRTDQTAIPLYEDEHTANVFHCFGKLEEKKLLKKIDIEVDPPAVGAEIKAPESILVDGGKTGIKIGRNAWMVCAHESAAWDIMAWDPLESGGVFEEGKSYALHIGIDAQNPYVFDPDLTEAYINGEKTNQKAMELASGTNRADVFHDFGKLENAPGKPVSKVEIELEAPKAGEKPACPNAVYGDGSENSVVVKKDAWLRCPVDSTDPEDWTVMGASERFETGKYYAYSATILPGSGYAVSGKTRAYINDSLTNQTAMELFQSGDMTVFHSFGKLGGTVEKTETPFTDVPKGAYYEEAVAWAFNNEPQITDGNGKDKFMPEQFCTRGQVVTFLWRAAGCPEPKTSKNPFADVKESDWFYKPVLWAIEKGITDGTSATTFSPAVTCKNSHILTFIYRAAGEKDSTGGQWWEEPLSWAGERNILNNTGVGKANISGDCPRKNVVQFLYLLMD